MDTHTHRLRAWGLGGAFWAILFAIWLLFFPGLIEYFPWVVTPRLAQAFVGAGYIFRTGFFLAVALEPVWHRIRWIFWGNLAFTGTLLLATFWHAEQFRWAFPISTGHLWLFLYLAEPVAMIYLAPRGAAANYEAPATAGPIRSATKVMLVVLATVLLAFGALLVINPDFAGKRWPWELNPLDSRISAAWFVGWSVWLGTMAFARDWDEIRIGVGLLILWGLALMSINLAFLSEFDLSRPTPRTHLILIPALTLVLVYLYWRQERARARTLRTTLPSQSAP